MTIRVRYFASLKDRVGHAEDTLDADETISVRAVWERANVDKLLPDNTLAAVNLEYVDMEYLVKDGDEVAFFPPVTGG